MNQAIAGARCAIHPDRSAQGTCKRCGNFACVECNTSGLDSDPLCITCAQNVVESRYHVVPMWRFVLLSLMTFGIYDLYWFWKNWSLVKRADGSDIWPIARAFFAAFSYFSLLTDINTRLALRNSTRELSTALGVGFLVMNALHRLPDPYWLISLFAFLFLVPAVNAIRELASAAAIAEGARWRVRHTVLMVIVVPFFLLAAIGTLLPDEQAEPGDGELDLSELDD